MNRRAFLSALVATPAGLIVPEPVKAYSFVGGWREDPYVLCSTYHYASDGALVRVARRLERASSMMFSVGDAVFTVGRDCHVYGPPGLDVGDGFRLHYRREGTRQVT